MYQLIGAAAWAPAIIFVHDHLVSISPVDGVSMQPTLNPDENLLSRDWVIAQRWGLSKLNRGDVVIFTYDCDKVVADLTLLTAHRPIHSSASLSASSLWNMTQFTLDSVLSSKRLRFLPAISG